MFLQTNNKLSENENKETIPFTIATKKNKILKRKLNQRGERTSI